MIGPLQHPRTAGMFLLLLATTYFSVGTLEAQPAIDDAPNDTLFVGGLELAIPSHWEAWPSEIIEAYQEYRSSMGAGQIAIAGFSPDSTPEWTSTPYLILLRDTIPSTWESFTNSKLLESDLRDIEKRTTEQSGINVDYKVPSMAAEVDRKRELFWFVGEMGSPETGEVLMVTAGRLIKGGAISATLYANPSLDRERAKGFLTRVWRGISIPDSLQYDDETAKKEVSDRSPLTPIRKYLRYVLFIGIGILAVALGWRLRT